MTWIKKKETQEDNQFWSHVETIAKQVRASQVYANNRVSQQKPDAQKCSSRSVRDELSDSQLHSLPHRQ